jgi:hypothetical protein
MIIPKIIQYNQYTIVNNTSINYIYLASYEQSRCPRFFVYLAVLLMSTPSSRYHPPPETRRQGGLPHFCFDLFINTSIDPINYIDVDPFYLSHINILLNQCIQDVRFVTGGTR